MWGLREEHCPRFYEPIGKICAGLVAWACRRASFEVKSEWWDNYALADVSDLLH
jgi:hypothetical protein